MAAAGSIVHETGVDIAAATVDLVPLSNRDTFVSGVGAGTKRYYSILHRTEDEWEYGYGTVTDAATDTLSRDTVLGSSNGGAKVTFSAGTVDIFSAIPAEKAVYADPDGFVMWAGGNFDLNAANLATTGTLASGSATVTGFISATSTIASGAGGNQGLFQVLGRGTGFSDGGQIQLYNADDYDSTVDYWQLAPYEGPLVLSRFLAPTLTTVLSVSVAGHFDFQSGNLTTTGTITGGNIYSGVDDTTVGTFTAYGGGTGVTSGGSLSLYNSADHDSTVNRWILRPESGELQIVRQAGGTFPVVLAFDTSGNADLQSGNFATTGTFASGAATITGDASVSGLFGVGSAHPGNTGTYSSGGYSSAANTIYSANIYYSGGWKFYGNGYASMLVQGDAGGGAIFYVTANNASGVDAAATPIKVWACDAVGGMTIGSPTGGFKGAGTLNAVAVYDDNVLLTDYVLDTWVDGKVKDEDKEKRKANEYRRKTVAEYGQFILENRHLPSVKGRAAWEADGPPSVGELSASVLEAVEELATYVVDLKTELDELRAEIERLNR